MFERELKAALAPTLNGKQLRSMVRRLLSLALRPHPGVICDCGKNPLVS